ncbi:hypothetical protein [Pseudoflavitalea rhizosphaerae]|uniref:hypothetical protein n=1 Tax=Pseudoflavitalea rhizosphaerae TaxID=1884793 RepID=UPI000F8E797C|nr:hypothetical protein [Pseudoflavitalea rhizosphaerae]
MRKIYSILLCSISLVASAQINNQLPLPPGTVSFVLEDRPVHERMHPAVQGSPLLQNDWAEGAVTMADGRNFYGVSLLYNLYDDILYFKRDKEMCEFTDPVLQFMFRYARGNDSVTALYRSGFPATGKNTERSFYEVLADGKYQLLNHRYKTLVKVKGDYVRKDEYNKFEDKTQLYLYNTDDKNITRLNNFTDLSTALGVQAGSLAGIMGKSKIKMKNENDLIMLVTALNHKK